MELTHPLPPDDLLAAYPRELRNVVEPEIALWLEMQETALRAQYRVSRTDEEADAALRSAMLTAWPSFSAQVRQVSEVSISTSGVDTTYARAGVIDFAFPAFVGAILAPVADPVDPVSSTIRLVRG